MKVRFILNMQVPLGLAVICVGALGLARAQEGSRDNRAQDRAAVHTAMQSFVKAFESGDAKALADHWTEGGEYVREDGGSVHGRDALRKAFTEFFAKSPKAKAEVETESVRFLSRDNAIEEGYVTMRTGPSDPAVRSRYNALFVREDARWRLAFLREWPGEETVSLKDLGWLVGTWASTGQANEISTTYTWDVNQKFLFGRFTIKEKDRTLTGLQILGKDPSSGELRAWTFEAEGGIGEATWERDGEHWTAEAVGTLADGRKLTSTNILRRINNDTFTWQSIERRLDDSDLPDLPPTKVTRVKAAK
jgi:uncharacterized protein (TIGR02246 family)